MAKGRLLQMAREPMRPRWRSRASPHDGGASGVAFPQPLRPSDAALMRRIFAFQARGDIPDAVRSESDLEDPLLLGAVLADRYLGRYHRSTADELSDWLARYGDQPDAPAIYALLLTRLPKGARRRRAPETAALSRSAEPDAVPEDIDPPRNDLARNPVLDRTVIDRAQRGDTASALRLITTDAWDFAGLCRAASGRESRRCCLRGTKMPRPCASPRWR